MNENFFDYLGRVDLNKQVENDIRILTKKNKKKNSKAVTTKIKVEKIHMNRLWIPVNMTRF